MSSSGQTLDSRHNPAMTTASKVARKRTKTGCLTCRKRRIKCGEQKPVCHNCIKSKRICEYGFDGHTRRPPPRDSPNASNGPLSPVYPASAPSAAWPATQPFPQRLGSAANAGADDFGEMHDRLHPSGSAFTPTHTSAQMTRRIRDQWRQKEDGGGGSGGGGGDQVYQQAYGPGSSLGAAHREPDQIHAVHVGSFGDSTAAQDHSPLSGHAYQDHQSHPSMWATPAQYYTTQSPSSSSPPPLLPPPPPPHHSAHPSHTPPQHDAYPFAAPFNTVPVTNAYPQQPFTSFHHGDAVHGNYGAAVPAHLASPRSLPPGFNAISNQDDNHHTTFPFRHKIAQDFPSELVHAAAVDTADSDYYDVEDDDDIAQGNLQDHPHALDAYRPERGASPLKNPATARVFAHFVSTTVRMLPPFQRNGALNKSRDSSSMRGHNLFTHVIPSMALHDPALLQAVLALSSLQIAALYGHSKTPSLKHYAWALRRIRQSVFKVPRPPLEMTLAAFMLLQLYDVSSADLIKWISNLRLAKGFLMEVDYEPMVRRCHHYSLAAHAQQPARQGVSDRGQRVCAPARARLDEDLISTLVGYPVTFSSRASHGADASQQTSQEEIDTYHTYQDLFWWYLKDDSSQALIYSTPFMMDYKDWTRCPPRAPIGVRGAEYGTSDHLVLLQGRVLRFVSEDIPRKKAQNKIQGSQWPDFDFDGLAPSPVRYMSPSVTCSHWNPAPEPTEAELPAATEAASQEYHAILKACLIMEAQLEEVYPALRMSSNETLETPWGPALFFENCSIALIWMQYFTIRVVLERANPLTMPPAMNAAITASIETTQRWASLVSRIATGVAAVLPEVDPTQPGSLHEMIGPLTHCGRQMVCPKQRKAIVELFQQVETQLGQASAGLCVSGCEGAWKVMADNGLGPPYTPTRVVREVLSDAHGIRLEVNGPDSPTFSQNYATRSCSQTSLAGMKRDDRFGVPEIDRLTLSPGYQVQQFFEWAET